MQPDSPALVLRADARSLPLPDASVDLIVTSPPYYGLRSYTDAGEHYDGQIGDEPTPREYIASLIDCTREWMRVLKPSGSIFVNLGDSYSGKPSSDGTRRRDKAGAAQGERGRGDNGIRAKSLLLLPERYRIAAVDQLGLIARAVLVWSKPNGLPESVTDRVRRSHEDWVHLTKRPRYFSAVDEIREQPKPGQSPAALSFNRPGRGTAPGQTCAPHRNGRDDQGLNPLGKLPGSVWEIPTEPLRVPAELGVDHFAAFPTEWPRRLVLGWSPRGGIVLDPFGGTGTTALVASALGRIGISVDRSADYCRLARWRTTDPAQRAKAARLPAPPKQFEGQADLLDLIA